MRTLGIDPGIANTGLALVESTGTSYALRYHATLRTSKKDTESVRYRAIQYALAEVIDTYAPDLIAIERVFFNNNISSAMTTAGVIAIALCEAEAGAVPNYLLTPQEIKSASELSRTASKASMAKVATRLFGLDFTETRQNHAIDAAFAAICGILKNRANIPNGVSTEYVSVPASAIAYRNRIHDEMIREHQNRRNY